jgi:DNA-binding CsgD family transcriptional regulator
MPLSDYLQKNQGRILERMIYRFSLVPKTHRIARINRLKTTQRRVDHWLTQVIEALDGKDDLFLIDQQRAAELLAMISYGLEFAYMLYTVFQETLEEILLEDKHKEIIEPAEVQKLNSIILQGFYCISNFYISAREDRITKILQLQDLSAFQRDRYLNPISAREFEILHHIAAGEPDRKIASILHISEHTVRSHVRSLFRKLDVSSRSQLISKAFHLKLIEAETDKKSSSDYKRPFP